MVCTNVAHAAGQHDRFVITAHFFTARRLNRLLEGAEVAGQGRTTKFVVKRRAAQRAFEHDVQWRNNALGLAIRHFPRLLETRDVQVGYGETGQARFRLGATAGGTFIANLATGTGRRAGKRRNGGRVVVRFHLHQNVHRLLHRAVLAGFGVREETPGCVPDDHRSVVLISGQHAFAVHLIGIFDHAEQGFILAFAVDIPAGIENLVPAMLGVGLGEHHQFDVVGVTPQTVEAGHQIVDFVFSKGQTQLNVGFLQRCATATEDVHSGQRLGLGMAEQCRRAFHVIQHQLRHAVVQQLSNSLRISCIELTTDVERQATLDALNLRQAAVAGNIAGLARPGRDGAKTRNGQKQATVWLLHRHTRAVFEQTGQHLLFVGIQNTGNFGKMRELGVHAGDRWHLAGQLFKQFAVTESRKSGSAAQDQHRGQPLGRGVL